MSTTVRCSSRMISGEISSLLIMNMSCEIRGCNLEVLLICQITYRVNHSLQGGKSIIHREDMILAVSNLCQLDRTFNIAVMDGRLYKVIRHTLEAPQLFEYVGIAEKENKLLIDYKAGIQNTIRMILNQKQTWVSLKSFTPTQ